MYHEILLLCWLQMYCTLIKRRTIKNNHANNKYNFTIPKDQLDLVNSTLTKCITSCHFIHLHLKVNSMCTNINSTILAKHLHQFNLFLTVTKLISPYDTNSFLSFFGLRLLFGTLLFGLYHLLHILRFVSSSIGKCST